MVKFTENPIMNWVAGNRIIIEIMLSFVTFTCFFLHRGQLVSDVLLMPAMLTLAGFYFIGAFFPADPSNVVIMISSKVIGIATSVAVVGILYAILQIEGARNMLFIGTVAAIPATIGLGINYLRRQSDVLLLLSVRGLVILTGALYYLQLTAK